MADLGFDGKVAIITGAGGGLGRQHALLLASRGAQIVVNDLGGGVDGTGGSEGPAHTVGEEIEAVGGIAVADTHSVASPEGGAAIVKTALDAFGRVDIVINNAGILRDKTFHNMDAELLDPVIDVHLKGAFNVTRPAWVTMREQGYGRVVSTSSAAGIFGNFGQTNYGAAKMGLVGFTRVLAVEGAKYNIKANVIAPLALTRMTEDIMGPMASKVAPEKVVAGRRLPRPRGLPRVGRDLLGGRRACCPSVHRRDTRLLQGRPHHGGRPRQLRHDPRRDGVRSARQPRRGDCAVLAVLQELKPGG